MFIAMKKLLWDVKKSSSPYGMRIDYSKGEAGGRIDGFSNDSGTVEILEGSDYEFMDMVSSFIVPFANRVCRIFCGSVTEVFSFYVDDINLNTGEEEDQPGPK